jgi:hypothetical protein
MNTLRCIGEASWGDLRSTDVNASFHSEGMGLKQRDQLEHARLATVRLERKANRPCYDNVKRDVRTVRRPVTTLTALFAVDETCAIKQHRHHMMNASTDINIQKSGFVNFSCHFAGL